MRLRTALPLLGAVLVAGALLEEPADAHPGHRPKGPASASAATWRRVADCETGARSKAHPNGRPGSAVWAYNGRSGYDGGLQFSPRTWSAYRVAPRRRRAGEPAFAWQASPGVQMAVANRVLHAQGWAAWPVCSRRLGLR